MNGTVWCEGIAAGNASLDRRSGEAISLACKLPSVPLALPEVHRKHEVLLRVAFCWIIGTNVKLASLRMVDATLNTFYNVGVTSVRHEVSAFN